MVTQGVCEFPFFMFQLWKINVYPYFLPSSQCRVCIIAGNISPIDVITHVPILCEDKDIPYVYVSSKEVSNQLCAES